jgi:tRNA(Ile)-lysidine synthase
LAVAVSGGPDSMALCLFAARWAQARCGTLTALTVDHGLRPESGAEARQARAWLEQRGIRHHVLRWQGPKPSTGVQAAARAARYALLTDWCRAAGVLHLLLGHHRDDQAETLALRAARQSGLDGLAGMAPVRELAGLRLLRPLLTVPKQRLIATLRAAGQAWIEDPSNRAPGFARARLRGSVARQMAFQGAAAGYAAARAALDRRTAAWLATAARIDPAGFVRWPRQMFVDAPPEIARRALQQALAVIGGRDYPPRTARLDRLLEALVATPSGAGRTLAGCRIVPRGSDLLICREPAATAPPLVLETDVWQLWDRRWLARWRATGDLEPRAVVRMLGADGWRQCKGHPTCAVLRDLPAAVRIGLASVWQDERLLAVARLGPIEPRVIMLRFRPQHPLAGPPFVALAPEPAPYLRIARDHTFASG